MPRYVMARCPACPTRPPIWTARRNMTRGSERCFVCAQRMAPLPIAAWFGRPVVHCAACRRHASASPAHFSVSGAAAERFACPHCGAAAPVVGLTSDVGARKVDGGVHWRRL